MIDRSFKYHTDDLDRKLVILVKWVDYLEEPTELQEVANPDRKKKEEVKMRGIGKWQMHVSLNGGAYIPSHWFDSELQARRYFSQILNFIKSGDIYLDTKLEV